MKRRREDQSSPARERWLPSEPHTVGVPAHLVPQCIRSSYQGTTQPSPRNQAFWVALQENEQKKAKTTRTSTISNTQLPYCASFLPSASVPVSTKSADPQMQSAFPAYYAPVQMAGIQPFGAHHWQPALAMHNAYVPMAYQTTAAPVQPPVSTVPTVRPAPAM